MREVEVKILEVNRSEIEKKLLVIGAKKTFEKEFVADYFDDGSLKEKKLLVRVRKEGEKVFFTLKVKISGAKSKIADEYEIEVSDFETISKQLELLGYKKYLRIRKTRIQYDIEDTHFVFDKYHDDWSIIPEFLEIESDDEKKVLNYAKKLDFSEEDCKPMSGRELYKYYLKLTS